MLSTVVLWVLFVVIELSDVFDGMVARRRQIVSDLGKLLDPFADVVSRLTYFIVFCRIFYYAGMDVCPHYVS